MAGAKTFNDLTPAAERTRLAKVKPKPGGGVLMGRTKKREVLMRKQTNAGDGMATTEPDTRRREILQRINELASEWMNTRDARAADVFRDEAVLRVISSGEGKTLATELRGLTPPPALALKRALGLDGTVAKGATLATVVEAARTKRRLTKLAEDPFSAPDGGVADEVQRLVLDPRPDLGALSYGAAVEKVDALYPGLIAGIVARAGGAPDERSAAAEVEKRARERIAADPDLSIERARDAVMADDPQLAARALDEEG